MTLTEAALRALVAALPEKPRVIASGNGATPAHLLSMLDGAIDSYRLFVLNAHRGIPTRPGARTPTTLH